VTVKPGSALRVGIKTMGCRVNHAEAAVLAGALEYEGFQVVTDGHPCEALVLHSCVITAEAQRETLRLVRAARRRGVEWVLVSGCATSIIDCAALFEAGVDGVVDKRSGTVSIRPGREDGGVGAVVAAALAGGGGRSYLPAFASTRATVKIQDGCDFRCAYCIVPDARGGPKSRPSGAVLEEVARLAARGYREIVLTGVNVACWGEAGMRLADLVRAALPIDGVARIRLGSIEPGTIERELVDVMAAAGSRLCRSLHYPLQSGDAGVLRRMRRRYTPEAYGETVREALARVPRLGLGADVITGFPGEDDAAFAATMRLVEALPFSNLHVFPYSERPGTPAAGLDGVVPVQVRRERARELIALGGRKREAFARSWVGQCVEVLVERVDDDGTGRGWTGEYLEARIPGLTAADVGVLKRVHVLKWAGLQSGLICV